MWFEISNNMALFMPYSRRFLLTLFLLWVNIACFQHLIKIMRSMTGRDRFYRTPCVWKRDWLQMRLADRRTQFDISNSNSWLFQSTSTACKMHKAITLWVAVMLYPHRILAYIPVVGHRPPKGLPVQLFLCNRRINKHAFLCNGRGVSGL
jgi:hypothetical protein